jgi:hypothetical protein
VVLVKGPRSSAWTAGWDPSGCREWYSLGRQAHLSRGHCDCAGGVAESSSREREVPRQCTARCCDARARRSVRASRAPRSRRASPPETGSDAAARRRPVWCRPAKHATVCAQKLAASGRATPRAFSGARPRTRFRGALPEGRQSAPLRSSLHRAPLSRLAPQGTRRPCGSCWHSGRTRRPSARSGTVRHTRRGWAGTSRCSGCYRRWRARSARRRCAFASGRVAIEGERVRR